MPAPVLMLNKDELTQFFRLGEMSSITRLAGTRLREAAPTLMSHDAFPI